MDEALCQCLLLELLVCVASLQVRDWVKAVLKTKRLDEGKAAAAAQRLEDEEVTGAMLFGFTADKLLDYGVKRGPADTLVNQLQASGSWAPPTTASGFQVGASADWKGAWASHWKFVRTTQAPRSSSRSWPTLRHEGAELRPELLDYLQSSLHQAVALFQAPGPASQDPAVFGRSCQSGRGRTWAAAPSCRCRRRWSGRLWGRRQAR